MTAKRDDYLALALRCEKEEPSRKLDAEIGSTLEVYSDKGSALYDWPLRYTTSLDAAVTLVPEGWCWMTGTSAAVWAGVRQPSFMNIQAKTPALRLCVGALRARAAMEPT
jgi:hypothetical protein